MHKSQIMWVKHHTTFLFLNISFSIWSKIITLHKNVLHCQYALAMLKTRRYIMFLKIPVSYLLSEMSQPTMSRVETLAAIIVKQVM